MFFLKKRNSDSINCDEFGWWLTGPNPSGVENDPEVFSPREISTISCADPDRQKSFIILQDCAGDAIEEKWDDPEVSICLKTENDPEEICFAEEPPCKTSSRSYTPERLIRTQDYRILTQSPSPRLTPVDVTPSKQNFNRRQRNLNHLIDKKLIGASHLEAIFDPDASDIKIPVALGGRKISKDHFRSRESSSCGKDLLAIANSESPRRSLTPDLMSSGSSCEHLNYEWHSYNGGRISEEDSFGFGDVFGNGKNSRRDEISREGQGRTRLIPDGEKDPEIMVENLRGRIDHIREINKDIFEDLSSLRKNYQWAETKTGNLTTETTRLRREIRDLRYLDDLVNLLRGELERISRRNWPFNLGHIDHHSEELNLVI